MENRSLVAGGRVGAGTTVGGNRRSVCVMAVCIPVETGGRDAGGSLSEGHTAESASENWQNLGQSVWEFIVL